MVEKTGYEEQKKLSVTQCLAELPNFIVVIVSSIISQSILVLVDALDSFGYILRNAMVAVLSKKLSKDLRFEYNYGVGKIEAISSITCDGLIFFGFMLTIGFSIQSIFNPSQPSDLLIGVVGFKIIAIVLDIAFFIKQRKIIKMHKSAISETNYAAAKAALLSDSVTFSSLLIIWLLRNNPIGLYISPVISIILALYLMVGCVKRTKNALDELTDKTLPEDIQMKILNILNRFFNSYSQFHSINSQKSGDLIRVDLHLSFEKGTTFKEIIKLKKEMQAEFDKQISNCTVNIIVEND